MVGARLKILLLVSSARYSTYQRTRTDIGAGRFRRSPGATDIGRVLPTAIWWRWRCSRPSSMRPGSGLGYWNQSRPSCSGSVSTPWAALERSALVIVPGERESAWCPHPPQSAAAENAIAIHVPCGPIVTRLRTRLLADQDSDSQHPLRFPPAAVSGDRRSARDNS